MKKFAGYSSVLTMILWILLLFFISSCKLEETKPLSVTAAHGSFNPSLSAARYLIEEMTDDTYFKADRKVATRGSLLGSYTPEEFVLDLDSIDLYSGNNTVSLAPFRTTPEGYIVPRHVNISYANDFIRASSVSNQSWNGLAMQFLPGIGGTSPMSMQVMSIVGVDLGADYTGIELPNEKTTDLMNLNFTLISGLHYFEFSGLQPYDVNFLSYLIIGDDIQTTGIQNPNSEMPPSSPGYWDLPGGGTSGNASMIFIPGRGIDITSYTYPEIVFNWDLTDLVQIYQGQDPGPEDDVVTFNLTTPFPVSLTVRENTNQDSVSDTGDTTAPDEVALYGIYGSDSYNVLIWINPKSTDFEKIVIVRKLDSVPSNRDDGEIVYEGYEPNFCDPSGISGEHYYYKIFTVDYAGNYSPGVVLDRIIQ